MLAAFAVRLFYWVRAQMQVAKNPANYIAINRDETFDHALMMSSPARARFGVRIVSFLWICPRRRRVGLDSVRHDMMVFFANDPPNG